MKTRTYKILACIPIVGVIAKCIICDPSISCTPMRDEGLNKPILEYMKKHPDIQITRILAKKIMNGEVK